MGISQSPSTWRANHAIQVARHRMLLRGQTLTIVTPGWALSLWTRLIDGQGAVTGLHTVEFRDCSARRLVTGQLHKAETLTLAGLAVRDQTDLVDFPIGGK